MITLRGRLPFALPLKQRCCRRRRRGLRSDRVSPQRRSLHTRERASERSSSQVNESNRSATSFSPPSSSSAPSHTLESESARPAPPSSAAESIKHWSKNAGACVCGGRTAANRGGWIADDGLDGGRARRRIIKWIRGLEGRRPKNEGLPQTTKIGEGREGPRERARAQSAVQLSMIYGPHFTTAERNDPH